MEVHRNKVLLWGLGLAVEEQVAATKQTLVTLGSTPSSVVVVVQEAMVAAVSV